MAAAARRPAREREGEGVLWNFLQKRTCCFSKLQIGPSAGGFRKKRAPKNVRAVTGCDREATGPRGELWLVEARAHCSYNVASYSTHAGVAWLAPEPLDRGDRTTAKRRRRGG